MIPRIPPPPNPIRSKYTNITISSKNDILFTHSDGSILRRMSAKDLIKIPIWDGNRHLDEDHVNDIRISLKGSIKALDLKPYHIVRIKLFSEDGKIDYIYNIVDGQHRVSVLKSHFLEQPSYDDFEVLVVEKHCESESEVIQYFRILNNTKAMPWFEDTKLCANRYIKALEDMFNSKKAMRIRSGATRKPYLSADRLREELIKRRIGQNDKDKTPEEFAELAVDWNQEWLEEKSDSADPIYDKYKKLEFALAFDDKFRWLDKLLC